MNIFLRTHYFVWGIGVTAVVLTGLLLGCGKSTSDPPPKATNVILIISEALPANRLGCYGGDTALAPHIDELAEDGILFEKFHSAAPWTMPSVGSILTGLSPPLHRAGRYQPMKDDPTKLSADLFGLLEDIPFLPELLGDIHTLAVINNAFIHKDYGFNRGWDVFNQHFAGFTRYRDAATTTRQVLDILSKHKKKPFFMMAHYFDPHVPYRPPGPFDKKFHQGSQGRVNMRTINQLKQMRANKFWPDEEEQKYLRGLHDGEIAYLDSEIGTLVEGLAEMGLLDNTWVVFTADHGEELFEHGGFEHGHRYEEEVTKVPLIIRAPEKWGRGTRVKVSARQIDIAPTILHLFKKQVDERMEGRDLMPLITGAETAHRPAYIAFNLTDEPAHAFFDGRYKIIQTLNKKQVYMYDIDADPGEKTRLNAKHPEFARMMKQLRKVHDRYESKAKAIFSQHNHQEISPAVLESLRSLGYID